MGVLLSIYSIESGLVPFTKIDHTAGIWTFQNMLNGFIVLGLLGFMYSVVFDGVAVLTMLNFYVNPFPIQGLWNVCIVVGLARIIATIYYSLCTFASAVRGTIVQRVVDIRDGEHSKQHNSVVQCIS